MRKIKFFVGILGLFLGLFITHPVMAEETSFVTAEEAYDVAVNFISGNVADEVMVDADGDLYTHGYTTIVEKGFPKEFAVQEIKCFYDSNQEVSAYYMPVIDVNGQNCGYVIVSADKNAYPIIEYAYDGVFYLEDATSRIAQEENIALTSENETEIFYLGGLCYALSIGNDAYVVNDFGYEEVEDVADLAVINETQSFNSEEAVYIQAEWDALGGESSGSNPPVGSFITTPDDYESGYSNKTTDYCVGMGTSYYIMTDFSSGGVCTPTAATNLCLYWTRRDSAYSNLCADTWQNTFNRIFALMGTSTETGTVWPSPARTGILEYFKERGFTGTEAYYSTCTSTTHFNDYIKAEINVGRPVLIALWDDQTYGNHTVLGVGYTRYMYNGTYTSHYIRIVDGWKNTVDRYVHYETGRTSITRIRVIPG
ncbi:MAG: Spi family protease inhibitor [Lachnospiraceae bacterium]|nr:Spi family protease inhibitor [Lachnospiraceae bacterium]